MEVWLAFCFAFIAFPILFTSITRIFQILYGPLDDSPYEQFLYKQQVKRSIIEIGLMYAVLLFISLVMILILVG